jgi:transcriptional regulator with XRE-family HTH domain
MNSTLFSFRQFRHWQEEELASRLSISIEEYKNLETGTEMVDAQTAVKLSELFLVPPQIFLSDNPSNHYSTIYSLCLFENSNGYVNYLHQDNSHEKNELILLLKEEVKRLQVQNSQLIELLIRRESPREGR